MLLRVVYILLYFEAFQQVSGERSTTRYDLCKVGEAITSLNGTIYASMGVECSRLILAPLGYRIEVNVTKKTEIREQVNMYIYDGATQYHNGEKAIISRHRVLDHHIATSTSNALFFHIDTIVSAHTNVDITFKMFRQPPERCLCLPVTHGHTTCSFSSQFYRDDTLYKVCTVSCGQNRFIANRFFLGGLKVQCFMGDPEHDLYGKGKWNTVDQVPIKEDLLDDQLITCARIFPSTSLKIGYKFSYMNESCADVNGTLFRDKVQEYLSTINAIASAGQCFKSPNAEENKNCTVQSVNVTCAHSGNAAQVTLIVRDNVINSTNETVVYKRYNMLYAAFSQNLDKKQNLVVFINQNLKVKNTTAVSFTDIYHRRPLENCPVNSGFQFDFINSRLGCLNCPPHFYALDTAFLPCQECKNGTRRNSDETSCIPGLRDYSKPSQTYCKQTCNLGKYYNSNSSLCDWCPYGTYQNSTTAFHPVCTPCPPGLTTGFVGARNVSECIKLCPAGSYLKYTECLKCGVGYYMPNASNRFPKCHKCLNGFTTLDVATTDGCVRKCSVGEHFNMTLKKCTLCPNNTYQDEVNDTNTRNCKKCPLNTITINTGATMLSDCLGPCGPGQYIDIGLRKCSPCPQNTYHNETQHVSFSCKSCGQHKITLKTGSTNVSECIYTCGKGEFFNLTSESCQKCPINMYQDRVGKDNCISCEGKSVTLKVGSIECISPCKFGQFLNKITEKCQNCLTGFYQNASDYVLDICHPCEIDFYSDKSGQRNCTACRDGTVTLITGAASDAECIETCQPGFYLNQTSRRCEECLKGFYQDQNKYRHNFCIKCPSANLTTLASAGATSAEQCVGYCTSSPCLNGGECTNIDNDFNCSCPKFLTGKQCEIVVDKNNSDIMEISIRLLGLGWEENLQSPESLEFKQLATKIENAIRRKFENDATFRTVKVTEFHQGSVISDLEFTYAAGVNFYTPADTLSSALANGSLGNISVDTSSVTITNYTCSQPLGMVNGRIPDSAITSGVPQSYHPPENARLNNPGPGWAPLYISGDKVYLQVDFLEEVWLTGIATRGSSYYEGSWLAAFYFQKSLDAKEWSYYVGNSQLHHVFSANSDVNSTVHNTLPYPVKTRYIRMFEYHIKKWVSFRVEFYGCPIPKSIPLPTLKPTVPTDEPSVPGTTHRSVPDDDEEENVGLIVGVVLGVLAFCVILVVLVVWCVKRNKLSHPLGSNVNIVPLKDMQ